MLSIGPVRYNEILFNIFIMMAGQCLFDEIKTFQFDCQYDLSTTSFCVSQNTKKGELS